MNDTLQQLLNEEDSARAKNINVDTMLTHSSKRSVESVSEQEELKILKKNAPEPRPHITETKPKPSEDERSGQPSIRSESVKPEENYGKNENARVPEIVEDTKNLPSVLPEQNSSETSPNSEIIASQSMSLLDESANHMFGLMRGLHANQPPAEIRSFDPERVNSAVACANTIYKIMRLKLDAIKVQRKLK